jgi:glycosyltransferase involved in cell wall biosynthesis
MIASEVPVSLAGRSRKNNLARRVVQMTSAHPPFDARIYHKECMSLAMAGYDVTLIVPYAGSETAMDGIKLRKIAPPRGRSERMTRTVASIYRAALKEDAEVYHFHDPELMPVGMLLKLHGKKVIYDVHEDYASNMRKQWIPAALRGLASFAVRACEAAAGRACDRIVAATPKIADNFNAKRASVVQNFPWTSEFTAREDRPYLQREQIVAYIGYLADSRGLREMAEAIRIVNDEAPARLIMAGRMVSGAQSDPFEGGDHVELLGEVDRSRIADLLSRSRIGLVVYRPTPNYYSGQPTKLLEYMAAGLPVVASDFPFYRQVIESSSCGLLVDPLQPKEIAKALLWLLQNETQAEEMGRRGRKAVLERYNWEIEAKRLISVYDSL